MKVIFSLMTGIMLLPLAYSGRVEAIMFNGINFHSKSKSLIFRNYPEAPLEKEYSIKCHRYWPDKKTIEKLLAKSGNTSFVQWREKHPQYRSFLDETFLKNLKNAKLLYIGQYNEYSQKIFDAYPNEIKEFLSHGGVIFFDFLGGVYPELNKFLNAVNVKNPCSSWKTYKQDFCSKIYQVELNPACKNLPILNQPWKIRKTKSHGWWTNWSDKQIVPFQNSKYPGKSAGMIIQENVVGHGKIIFNSIPCIFRAPIKGGNKKFLQNTLSYIIGKNILDYKNEMLEEKGGPGKPVI